MFYWLDSDYKDAKNDYKNAKKNKQKIVSVMDDMMNDSGSIERINRYLDYISDEFSDAVKVSSVRSRVSSKINNLKEPFQGSDWLLTTAYSYFDAECASLQKKMNKADAKMDKIKDEY